MPENRPVPSDESATELLELTAAQEGVRYGQLLDPDSPKYNIAECLEIRGGLDEELFAVAVDRVLHLCDSANTVLVERDGRVRQRVVRPREPRRRLRVVDLTGAADPVAAAERYMAGETALVDDVAAPAHHHALLRLGPDLHYWYVRYHHIAVDGLSGAVLARATAELYTRAVGGADPAAVAVPPGGRALRELVADEAAYRASERFAADRAYWVGRFADRADQGAGGGGLLRRRTDRDGGGAGGPGAGGLHTGETLALPVFDGLRRLAAESRTTWSAVLVAAVAAYAARVSGRGEVCVGLASHGRPGGLRGAVGMTATILPLPLAVEPGVTVGGLVRAVAAEMRGALRHRRFPREQLARELNLADGGARLTDLVVNIMGYDYALDFAGSPATSRLLSIGPVDDVSLFVSERSEGTGPLIGFDTNPELYHPEDVRLHQRAVLGFLAAFAAAGTDAPVDGLPLVDEGEARELLAGGRGAGLPAGAARGGLPEAFAARARRHPAAPAVRDGGAVLSYGELERAAAALGRALTGWGVRAEDGVGVLVGRSAAVVTASLGAVVAGAAYVPMDPDWPGERLDRAAGVGRVRALVVDEAAAGREWVAEAAGRLPVLVVDRLGGVLRGAPERPGALPGPVRGDRLAYTVFTSGSTGLPKGVGVTHADVAALAADAAWADGAVDAVLMHSAYVFDASTPAGGRGGRRGGRARPDAADRRGGAGHPGAARVRADRDDDVRDPVRGAPGGVRGAADRPAAGRDAPVRAGRGAAARPARRGGRVVRGRRGGGPRLPGTAGPDRGAVRRRPVRGRRRAGVPHRGPGALDGGRRRRVRGAGGRAGEAARLPDRARGGRERAAGPPGRGRRAGAGARGRPRQPPAGRLRGAGARRPAGRPRPGPRAGAGAARVHGARRVRPAGRAAAERQRQGGPAGAARTGGAGRPDRAAHRARGGAGGPVRRGPGPGAGRRRRRLLRPGRALAAGHPAGRPDPGGHGCRGGAARGLRAPDGRRAGGRPAPCRCRWPARARRGAQTRPAAAVVRAAAAVVPQPGGGRRFGGGRGRGRRRLQRAAGAGAGRAARRGRAAVGAGRRAGAAREPADGPRGAGRRAPAGGAGARRGRRAGAAGGRRSPGG